MMTLEEQGRLNSSILDEVSGKHPEQHFMILMLPKTGGQLTFSSKMDQATVLRLLKMTYKSIAKNKARLVR